MNKENLIVKVIAGSHLYGTDTKDSAIDYVGVFMPTKEQLYLNRIPKVYTEKMNKTGSKSTSEDIDIYSLHYFLNLACSGQTVALDILHAPDNMIVQSSGIWKNIVKNKDKFYSRNMKAFLGYARSQAARYGLRGDRINDIKKLLNMLSIYSPNTKMLSIWKALPITDNCKMIGENDIGIRQYQVCGKIIQETFTVEYVMQFLKPVYEQYGKRARKAADQKGIDWKAVSHAFRVAYELKELLTDKTITFPLKQADYVKQIKLGKLNYVKEVGPALDNLMNEIEILMENSDLPEKVDRKYWDEFLYTAVDSYISKS